MFAERHLRYYDCAAIAVFLCTEPEGFVADCLCAFVRFSSVSDRSQGSPLNMPLGFTQYRYNMLSVVMLSVWVV